MYPYYNTYSVFFGDATAETSSAVGVDLADYKLNKDLVLAEMTEIIESVRQEANQTWSHLPDVSYNDASEMRKAKLRGIAATTTTLDAIPQMQAKLDRFIETTPKNVAPLSLERYNQYIQELENRFTNYNKAIEELTKAPETYEQLTPEQKAEVDALQKKADEATKQAIETRKKNQPWYKGETPVYIGMGLILFLGGYSLYRGLK